MYYRGGSMSFREFPGPANTVTESGDKTVTITEFSNGKGSVAFSQKSSGYKRTKHMPSEEENFKAMDDAVKIIQVNRWIKRPEQQTLNGLNQLTMQF